MDWHKLQRTLYNLDPTDVQEDLEKLKASAQVNLADIPSTKDYVTESIEIPQGSMPLGIDNITDFAALAGVRLDEGQKHGDYARGGGSMPKAKPGRTKHPLKDKLVGEEDIEEGPLGNIKAGFAAGRASPQGFGAAKSAFQGQAPARQNTKPQKQKPQRVKGSVTGSQLAQQLNAQDPGMFNQAIQRVKQGQPLTRVHQAAMSDAFVNLIGMNPQETQKALQLLKRMQTTEAQETPKPRDPSSKTMQDIRKSGAAGAHKDKKKTLPRKQKHKGKQFESFKEMLYAELAKNK
jgi:hypothetical protein